MSNKPVTSLQPPNCTAQRDGYEQLINRASRLLTMSKTPGWLEEFEPMLRQRRQSQLTLLIEAQDHDEILRLQGGLREIDTVLAFVATTMQLAEAAQNALQNEPEAATPTRSAGQSS